MKILPGIAALSLTLCLTSGGMGAIYLSLDPFSPSLGPDMSAADVLVAGPAGLSVWIPGTNLGLIRDPAMGGDDLNALSSGRDRISQPVFFSVDHGTEGRAGSAVHVAAMPTGENPFGEAGATLFQALPPKGSNTLFRSPQQLGLIAGSPGEFGDDLNALSLLPFVQGVYFSIHTFSESIDEDAGVLPSTIFRNHIDNVFASWQDIGLDPWDDLNSLWLWDGLNPGTLDKGTDLALFSLNSLSPSLYDPDTGEQLHSAGTIWITDFRGTFDVWASAAEIGLRDFDDELNALSSLPDVLIPEPASLFIWGLLAASWLVSKRWVCAALRRPRDRTN